MIMLHKRILLAASIVLCLGVIALLPRLASSGSRTPSLSKEIVLVARDMSFFLSAAPAGPNPTIRLAPGEQVRLVFRNEDPGFEHDLRIDAWGIVIARLRSGESAVAVFQAPEKPGSAAYLCTFHAEMMKGTIAVVAP